MKLCVGVESPQELERRMAAKKESFHITRNFPTRSADLLDGGSLYWIFGGAIRARQKIIALERVEEEGVKKCKIVLGKKIILTESLSHRGFQGWRYFDNPPADLTPTRMSPDLIKALGLD